MDKKYLSDSPEPVPDAAGCFMDSLDSMVWKKASSIRCKTDTNTARQLVIHMDFIQF